MLTFRHSPREWVGAEVNVEAPAPYCTPIRPPGSLWKLLVEGTGVECIWATLKEGKRNTAEARRRALFALTVSYPCGQSRGRLSETTLTRKFAKSSEKWRPALVLEQRPGAFEQSANVCSKLGVRSSQLSARKTAVISSCKLLMASTKRTLLRACPPCRSALRRRVTPQTPGRTAAHGLAAHSCQEKKMAKIAKTADRKKVMDTSKSTACPKCGKDTRIVKRTKDRERGVPGGIYISCSACEFYEKL